MAYRRQHNIRMAALLGSAALWTMATDAAAQDATWSTTPENTVFGGRSDYQDPNNWEEDVVPKGTATFGPTGETDIFFENQVNQQPITIGRFVFLANAPGYTFTLQSDELTFTGDGIVNNASAVQTLISGNRSILTFANSSTAGNAAITVMGGTGRLRFVNTSSAANATITVGVADSAGIVTFADNATAGNATIVNVFGNVNFGDNSSAGDATIENSSGVIFGDNSSLGTADITNLAGGIRIFGSANGPDATIDNRAGAVIDVSQLSGGPQDVAIGSLSGDGEIRLGGRNLVLGGLGQNDVIGGAIVDGGDLGGTGGSLTKIGAGTLTLTGDSLHTGDTFVSGGTLRLTGSIDGTHQVVVGQVGNGDLVIRDGGTLTGTGGATIGTSGGTGNVLVTGAGSSWTVGGGLSMGLAPTGGATGGVGRLTIENGATVTTDGANLQRNPSAGSDGRVTVTGAGSTWNSGGLGITSGQSEALLTISAGATVNSTSSAIAAAMLVTGAGSRWTSGALIVGPDLSANGTPPGRLTIAGGAIVNSTSVLVGDGSLTPSVTVEGSDSTWTMTGDLVVARDDVDSGAVTVRNGATINVAGGTGAVRLGSTGGLAFLTIGGGAPGTTPGMLNAASVQIGGNALLAFDHAGSSQIFAPTIAGTGDVLVGGGRTILTGDSAAFAGKTTIDSGGILQIGSLGLAGSLGTGGVTGTLGGNIVNDGQLILARTGTLALNGIISGTGSLTHTGTSNTTTTLTADNGYTGATTVNGGTLLVNGSIASAVTVNAGGTLGGTGTVGSTTVADGGRLSPGNSIGTLNASGNLVFSAGSIFLVEVAPASADLVAVTGTASLAGTLSAIDTGGTYAEGQQYTLLSAAGGISGTFGALTLQGDYSGLAVELGYDADTVFLILSDSGPENTATTSWSDAIVFNAPTVTVERVSLFETRIIGRLAGGTALFDETFSAAFDSAIVQNAVQAARVAITAAGGPGVFVLVSDPVLVSRTVTSATSSLSTFTLAGSTETMTTTTTFGPATVTIGDARSCGGAVGALPSGSRPACGPPGGQSFDVEPGTVNINLNTHTEYLIDEARTDTITESVAETWEMIGTIVPVGTVHAAALSGIYDLAGRLLHRVGQEGAPGPFGDGAPLTGASYLVAAGGGGWAEAYGFRNRADARGGLPAERRDAWGLAGGFSYAAGEGLLLGFGVDHGMLDLDVPDTMETAEINLTQLALGARFGNGPISLAVSASYGFGSVDSRRRLMSVSTASYDADIIGLFAEARYLWETGAWRLVPQAGIDHVEVETEAFTESGALGLVVPEHDSDRTRLFAGLEFGRSFAFGEDLALDLSGSVRYLAVAGGEERTLPVTFSIAPGTPLVMRGLSERDSALVGAQARLRLTPSLDLYLTYDGRFAEGYDSHGVTAGISFIW